ncbi:MAG: hypothetical protein CMH83_03805 [Nocardioides sp.]|nr:hypothetical protein [Nocardioides sp.]
MAAENASVDDGFVDRVELPSMGSDGGDQRAHRLARRVGCDEDQALAAGTGQQSRSDIGTAESVDHATSLGKRCDERPSARLTRSLHPDGLPVGGHRPHAATHADEPR